MTNIVDLLTAYVDIHNLFSVVLECLLLWKSLISTHFHAFREYITSLLIDLPRDVLFLSVFSGFLSFITISCAHKMFLTQINFKYDSNFLYYYLIYFCKIKIKIKSLYVYIYICE